MIRNVQYGNRWEPEYWEKSMLNSHPISLEQLNTLIGMLLPFMSWRVFYSREILFVRSWLPTPRPSYLSCGGVYLVSNASHHLYFQFRPQWLRSSQGSVVTYQVSKALGMAQSGPMVQRLLSPFPPMFKQDYIRCRRKLGITACHEVVQRGQAEAFSAIWEHADMITRKFLLTHSDEWGHNLVIWAGCSNSRDMINLIFKLLNDYDCIDQFLTSKTCLGDSILHTLVIHQWVKEIAEILKVASLEQRRNLLSQENSCGYSPFQLAMIPPTTITHYSYNYIGLSTFINFTEPLGGVGHELLRILHFFTNEYDITSPASIIQHRLSAMTHHQLKPMMEPVSVSCSSYLLPLKVYPL